MNPSPNEFPHHELLAELGRGTTGIVYKVRDVRLNHIVALKTFPPCPNTETAMRSERFLREVRAMVHCVHDNIVTVHEADQRNGRPYCVREFVDGNTLAAIVAAKSIDLRTGLHLLRHVCIAVGVVHAWGFAHCGLHPANILVESARGVYRAKLIGFGDVGTLAESPHLQPGYHRTPAVADTQALHQMLHGLADALGQPLPKELAALGVSTPAALADALRHHI